MVTLPRQNNYEVAADRAWARLLERPADDLRALGAQPVRAAGAGRWALEVLDAQFEIDPAQRTIALLGGGHVGTMWHILALHYLLARLPVPQAARQITFEEIPDARGYAAPYNGRVISLFCATVGRSRETLLAAAERLRAAPAQGGDLAFQLQVFPHVPLDIVWYAGDAELPAGAGFLYADNIAAILDVEDIVVMAERVVSRLRGKPW